MIAKKEKGNLIEDLRTINLMEACFNFNNKFMARSTMKCAEENKLLPAEQYSSRKLHCIASQAINKRLVYDISHLQKRNIALCSNDAKAYYNRIVHSIVSLAMQQLGMPAEPIISMLRTIQQIDHLIRTAYGDSESKLRSVEEVIPN